MNLKKLYLTENNCYKVGRKQTVKGIVVHSTGANNPNLKRYVGPDDGLLGKNQYNNHWNQDKPGGREVCVHAFIGKLKDGSIATYQTLPWDMIGWHAGKANYMGYIGFEICEGELTDAAYFNAVYKEAVELCAYLCEKYSIPPESPQLICHSEGYKLGIATNHSDVMHWFPKHGKSMDTFRADVKEKLQQTPPKPTLRPSPVDPSVPAPRRLRAGVKVKITGDKYATGQNIPAWVKAKVHTVKQIRPDRVLLGEIMSWVSTKDVKIVKGE